jgi:hypothetical protein
METRFQRARRDLRAWAFTPRQVITSLLAAPIGWTVQWLAGGKGLTAVWVPLVSVVAVAVLLPAVVYGASWATAVGRIHHDELVSLRAAVDNLRELVERRRDESEVVGKVKELRSFAEILSNRVPPWGAVPEGLSQEVDDWSERVSAALSPWPDLKAQFDGTAGENAALEAFKANPLNIRLANKKTVLDAIIKHLSAQEASS